MKPLILFLTLTCAAFAFVAGCSSNIVSVNHHRPFMAPDSWDIIDGACTISVYNGNCCCIAGRIADTVAARINRREYEWPIDSLEWIDLRTRVCAELRGGSGYDLPRQAAPVKRVVGVNGCYSNLKRRRGEK